MGFKGLIKEEAKCDGCGKETIKKYKFGYGEQLPVYGLGSAVGFYNASTGQFICKNCGKPFVKSMEV